jgi:hypothetical protein
MVLEDPELGQLAWHLGLASQYAVADQIALARTETLLAWAVLGTCKAARLDEWMIFETLVDPGDPSLGNGRTIHAMEDARESAYALIGHFTSEQRFDLVDLYERVVGLIERVMTRLDTDRDRHERSKSD